MRKIIFCLIIVLSGPIKAQTAQQYQALLPIEKYLNSLKTASGSFIQTASNGSRSAGRVFISRPGKMRMEYDPPRDFYIVINDDSLIYHDPNRDQTAYLNTNKTPAGVLLKPVLSFQDPEITLKDVSKNSDGLTAVTVEQTNNPAAGQLTMYFSENPIELKRWKILDANRVTINVALSNMSYGRDISEEVFIYRIKRVPFEDRKGRR